MYLVSIITGLHEENRNFMTLTATSKIEAILHEKEIN